MTVATPAEPRILPRSEHPISRQNISENAVKVLYRLHNAGRKAYLVGGGVRDLMLRRTPKDFDVATDARPNEIRKLFRNSRIIGRRFRLAHVYFKGGEIVEVSTFRRDPDPAAQVGGGLELLITDDNVFGTPEEDAFRRDFTVNALFYDIADFTVIDYVGGVADLEGRLIRAIGDPHLRFREDPVRMVRACEFAARLGFAIERETQRAIEAQRNELLKASPARLTEEIVQLLGCGASGRTLQWMLDLGLLEILLPEAYAMVKAGDRGLGEFSRILPVIDRLVAGGREVPDTALLAALLLPTVLLRRYDVEAIEQRPLRRGELQQMVAETVGPFFARFTVSNAKGHAVHQAILTFHRLGEPTTGSRWSGAERVLFANKPWFDDALFLFEVLVEATGQGREELARWQQARRRRPASPAVAEGGGIEERKDRPRRPRRGRRRRRR